MLMAFLMSLISDMSLMSTINCPSAGMVAVFAMIPVFCGFTAAKIIKLSEFCRKTCSNFAFFFYFCSFKSMPIIMLNTCKLLIINVMGGVNLRSMLSHTLSPRQDEVACLGFFCACHCERSGARRVFGILES